jgi:hypothetical protein
MRPATDAAAFSAGLVAAEGTFTRFGAVGFACVVALGASDRGSVEFLHTFFGVGRVRWYARRRAHYDDEITWTVRRLSDLVGVIVPFMDEHLPVSHKRDQYLAWRDALLDHWEHRARRRRACSIDGCDAPGRAHGLCRRHLYRERGV